MQLDVPVLLGAKLAEHGIAIPEGRIVEVNDVQQVAEQLEYPVVLKALSDELPHKSEAGAVRVNLQDAPQLLCALEAMRNDVAAAVPGFRLERVLIERMVDDALTELMVGINTDPQFGQLLVIASGGVLVELLRDAVTLLLPASDAQIEAAIRQLRSFPQLQGYRGKPAANLTALVKTVRALADFAESHSERLLELDVNPLLVTPTGCIAVDVMLRETLG